MKTDHYFKILKQVHIFTGLSEENLRRILENSEIVSMREGDILIHEGTPATEIYIILTGRLKIVLNMDDNPLEIVEFSSGECVGETSVIGILPHSASAVVMEDSDFLILSRKLLLGFLECDTGLFSLLILNIARELARRLHRTDEILLHYRKEK